MHVKLALPGDTTTWSIGGVVMTGLTGGGGGGGGRGADKEGGRERGRRGGCFLLYHLPKALE